MFGSLTIADLRHDERRMRAVGLFDGADMYRQLLDAMERLGGMPADVMWADRGRQAELDRDCFMPYGPRSM